MVVYTLLKKHAFAVLKCQKNGPSEQSEMTQDQLWPQGAHVWATSVSNRPNEITLLEKEEEICRSDYFPGQFGYLCFVWITGKFSKYYIRSKTNSS